MAELKVDEQKRAAMIEKLREKQVATAARYQRLLRLAQALFKTPTIRLSLLREEASWSFAEIDSNPGLGTSADVFCAYTIAQSDILVVEDTLSDVRFANAVSVANEPFIRFYAGVPLRVKGNYILGALSLFDIQPRRFTAEVANQLIDFAQIVAAELDFDLISEQITQIHKMQLLTECITRVQADFILEDDRRAAFERLLVDILHITDSGYGFIGEVLYDEYRMPYLKTFALTNIAWDEATQKFYDEHAPVGLEFRNLNSLFGYTLRTQQVMLTNSPADNPHACGIPKGHPPLNCYLGIPIFFGGQLIAMVGLANKADGYQSRDIEFLRPLTSTIGQLVYATRIKRQQHLVQQQLNNIVDASEIGTWTLDLKTESLEVNARWLQMLGYKPEELPQVTLAWMRQNMHPGDLRTSRESIRLHLEGARDFYESQFRIRHKSGHWVWIQARGRIMSETVDKPISAKLYGINIDITAEKSLQNQLSKLAEHVPGMVYQFQLNTDQSIVFPYVGPAVEKLLGFSATQLAQNGALVFSKVHPDDLASLHDSITCSASLLQQWQMRFRLAATGAGYRWLAGQSTPEKQDDGAVIWHGYIQDVTEETEMQLALEAAKAQAERAVATKSSFLANMSHEIRTPMNGVIGMLDILAENNTDANQAESISLMRESAYSLLTIIDDILDFSKLEAGKLNIAKEPLWLTPVVEQICSMLDYLALKSKVELTFYIDPAIDSKLLFDPNRLRQILVNLLSNAIKFSSNLDRPGQVRLAITLADKQQQQALLDFTITDNGIGMAPDVVGKLFQPFTQADDSTSRKYGGTGLGLAITHQLVQLMDGVVTAESLPGMGSTFKVTLPLEIVATDSMPEEPSLRAIELIILGEKSQQTLIDYANYLSAEGAKVGWLPLSAVTEEQLFTLKTRVVWLFDSVYSKGDATTLVDKIKQYQAERSRFVILGRGRRRKVRRSSKDTVVIDANVLQRSQLVQAVYAAYHDQELPLITAKIALPVASQQHYRILVLEDNSTNQKVIKQQLLRLGYQVVVAEDGMAGLRYTRKQTFDLILSDLHMPNMDGYQFVKAFRQEEQQQGRNRIPIIALTANIVPEELVRCKEEGMDDYLVKPLPVQQLKAALDTWLGTKKTTSIMNSKHYINTDTAKVAGSNKVSFDTTLLIETVGEDAVTEILRDYAFSLEAAMAKLEQAMVMNDYSMMATESHKLKSSSRFVGAEHLADTFANLEQEARQCAENKKQTSVLAERFTQLAVCAAMVLEALNEQFNT